MSRGHAPPKETGALHKAAYAGKDGESEDKARMW